MNFTLSDYLSDPSDSNAEIPKLRDYISLAKQEFQILKGVMTLKWFALKNDILVAYIQLPSRHTKGILYDIVLEFDSSDVTADTIDDLPVRVFSNCPSFTFRVAQAFDSEGLLIPWLKQKFDTSIFAKKSEIINPKKEIKFERSIYTAAMYLLSDKRNDLDHIKKIALRTSNVMDIYMYVKTEAIVAKLHEEKQKLIKEKKESGKKEVTPLEKAKKSTPKTSTVLKGTKVAKTATSAHKTTKPATSKATTKSTKSQA
jgi:hypothetical protein